MKHFAWFGCAGLLALGCGNETATTATTDATTGEDESSGSSPETTVTATTTVGPTDESSSGSADSSTGPAEGSSSEGSESGSESSSTGPAAECGNAIVEAGEDCDGVDLGGATCVSEGFSGGTIACATDCTFDTAGCAFCGNGTIDDGEVCDDTLGGQSCVSQGFDGGNLECAADCLSFDTAGCGLCGNDIIDGTEFCDGAQLDGQDCFTLNLGFDSGTLSCAANCTGFDTSTCGTCGNDFVDGDEECDGISVGGETCVTQGYDGGTLYCGAGCSGFDFAQCTTCGDGVAQGAEVCDGADLGGEDCASLGLTGGTLGCSPSCQYDITMCDVPGNPFGSDTGYNGYYIEGGMLPCDDITATGIGSALSDDSNTEVAIGFTFPFYDVDYTNVTLESNGALHFGGNVYLTLGNACVPNATMPSDYNLYTFWDDLNPGAAGDVYYQTLGVAGDQRFVVQWQLAHFGGNAMDLIDIRAVLYEATGQIAVCYVDTLSAMNSGDNGAEATSGIQLDSMTGFQYSCNTPDLVDGLQLLYVPN